MKAFARMTCQAVALRRLILVSSIALAAAGSGGCFSIKLDGEVREDVSYRVGFEDGIEVISLDDIEMLVTRAKVCSQDSSEGLRDFRERRDLDKGSRRRIFDKCAVS